MRLLGLDFETTGLDTGNDRIIEMGAVLWDVEGKKPIQTLGAFVFAANYPDLKPEITKLTGITGELLLEFSTTPEVVFGGLESFTACHGVDYLVAHNAENFDKPMMLAELKRLGYQASTLQKTPWIDTRTDIPFEIEPSSRRLNHLAADHGFVNPFAHRAVFDVLTMLRVLSQYDIQKVLEYQKIPFVTVQALVTFDERHLAKEQRFSWQQIGDKKYTNMWVKRIKSNLLEQERANCKFLIREIPQ